MKKTLFLTALLGVALFGNAQAGTATLTDHKTTISGTDYSGLVFTYDANTTSDATLVFDSCAFTVQGPTAADAEMATDGKTVTYTDSTSCSGVAVWQSFCNNQGNTTSNRSYGHTLVLSNSAESLVKAITVTQQFKFQPIVLGGLVTNGDANNLTSYVINGGGSNSTRPLTISANGTAIFDINANTTFSTGGSVSVNSDSSWDVAKDKTLAVNTAQNFNIASGKNLTLTGGGTVQLGNIVIGAGACINASAFTGTFTANSLAGDLSFTTKNIEDWNNVAILSFESSDKASKFLSGKTSSYFAVNADVYQDGTDIKAKRREAITTGLTCSSTSGLMSVSIRETSVGLAYTLSGDQVTLSSAVGYMDDQALVAADLKLDGTGIEIVDGYTNSQSAERLQFDLSGKITGSGDIKISKGNASGTSLMRYDISGDISEWTGDFLVTSNATDLRDKIVNFNNNTAKDGVVTINNDIKTTNKSTLQANIINDSSTIVAGDITKESTSGMKLSTSGTGTKAFNGTLDVTSLTVNGGAATINKSAVVSGVLNVNDGSSLNLKAGSDSTEIVTISAAAEDQTTTISGVDMTGVIVSGGVTMSYDDGKGKASISGADLSGGSTTPTSKVSNGTVTLAQGATLELSNVLFAWNSRLIASADNSTVFVNGDVILANSDTTSVSTIVLNGSTLTMGAWSETASSYTHDGTLQVQNKLTVSGANTTLNANLVMNGTEANTLHFDYSLTMGCTIDFGTNTTIELGDTLAQTVTDYGKAIILTSVDGISNLDNASYNGHALLAEQQTDGTYTIYATPEPATATLSLLALAGLAARRRRLR